MASENEFHRDVHTMQYHYMCVYIIMQYYVCTFLLNRSAKSCGCVLVVRKCELHVLVTVIHQ